MIRFDITTTNNKLLELTAKQQANKLSIKATQNPVKIGKMVTDYKLWMLPASAM